MDPVGWSPYASYNRLAGVQAGATSDIHSQLTQSGTPPTTTAQIIPGGFIAPTAVGYETVFTPIFHHAGSKQPVQYVAQVAQHRQPLPQAGAAPSKQVAEGEYQGQAYFDQAGGTWQQNSPFGVLPHESTTTTTKPSTYENFNAHYAAAQTLNHLNTQLVASSSKTTHTQPTTQSPKPPSQSNSTTFFQVAATYPNTSANNTKTFVSSDASNLQQSCIVASPSKDYRAPNRPSFPTTLARSSDKQTSPQIQTKAQTKIYPELNSPGDRQRSVHDESPAQSSPISYSMDINYAAKRSQFASSNYRNYQPGNNTETELQRIKNNADYNTSNGSDCRRSPLHSQGSHSPAAYSMYNSPSPQVTPSSPLDATVSRSNAQSGSVAYPSVITRALNTDKKFPEHYNRSLQQQESWEERQRKFQTHSAIPSNYAGNNMDQYQQRSQDRQQTYYNTTDLSSCRGDPISLVKGSQIQHIKGDPKVGSKRRRSNEKLQQQPSEVPQGPVMSEYFAGRIPPPAHSSASNPQQNGAYFDYDRWNLPPTSKMFGGQAMHQQHQGIMMPHPHGHHPPPPLPYFPPFHMPTHPEYPQAVAPPTYNEQSQQSTTTENEQNDQPKVVVPNIEEELGFLSSGTSTRNAVTSQSTSLSIRAPPIVNQVNSSDRTSGSAGFMNSYLKFLQGDRDSSPPPAIKGGRKQSWSRSKPIQITSQSNGVSTTPTPHIPAARLSQGDPQDDPRYFPLPKERKKGHFNSSDDGFSSGDDLFNKNVTFGKSVIHKDRSFKRVKQVPRRPPKKVVRPKKEKEYDEDMPLSLSTAPPPRRESSRRAAKDKSNLRQMIAEEEMDHLDYMDSDSDPAWSPKQNEDGEVVPCMRKGKKIRNGGKRWTSRNLITAAAQCAGINDLDGYASDGTGNIRKPNSLGTNSENNQSTEAQHIPNPPENPFKHGDFLVVKSDLIQDWPPIWRVDRKALLQRYEPFEQNDQTLYKNVQTFTSWTPESIKQYVSVPVNYKVQSLSEVIVEFLRSEMPNSVDFTIIEESVKKSVMYQDNFEVYIQTLISQALDSNFLTEIFQEQDEYFLSNVKTIDDVTENQKNKMVYLLQWPKTVQIAINTWPCFNALNDCNTSTADTPCAACLRPGVCVRVLMYGQPYNLSTLESCQPDPQVEKDFLMCRTCAFRVELFNKITHQKHLMFVQCTKKVTEKKTADSNKDTTCILNELLADESWLTKLFSDVRQSWGEVDSLENRFKLNNQCGDSSNNKTVV